MQSPTLTFVVRIDLHEGEKRNPKSLAKAIYRAISHATEVGIEGAELLDEGIGQISVHPANQSGRIIRGKQANNG